MSLTPARRKSAALLWWALPIVAIGGWWYPYLGLAVLICMLAPLAVAIYRGRYWCGWLCPRGAFYDFIMARFSPNRRAPAWLRSKAFRAFAMLFLLGMMGVQLVLAWPNPAHMARVFVLLLGITTVVGIALALVFQPRTWCSFCPMGTMASWLSKGKRPLQVSPSCRSCHACDRVCPMNLSPSEPDASHVDCLKCGQCVMRCPFKSLSFEDAS